MPNSLRYKVLGDPAAEPTPSALGMAHQTMIRHRLYRGVSQLADIVAWLEENWVGGGSARDAEKARKQIAGLLRRIKADFEPRSFSLLRPLVDSMLEIGDMVATSTKPNIALFKLFRLHSDAIATSLIGAGDTAALVARALNAVTEHFGQFDGQAVG